jgi:hypothetical protein
MVTKRTKPYFIASCLSLLIAAIPFVAEATVIKTVKGSMLVPTGKGWGVKTDRPNDVVNDANIPQNGIYYHGGPVMGTSAATIPNVYYIWYGNWSGNTAIELLTNFALGIGKTAYYNINTTYTDANGNPVMRAVNFPKPGVFDNYSQGTALSDNSIYAIVANAINTKQLPLDPNGIYFVLTSADVNETSGFCTSYCGWHTYGNIQNTNIKYAFVGNADRCPNACAAQNPSPNNNTGADAMASVIAHELEETVTDPNLNAWYDHSGQEVADKCAWQFGKTSTAANGSQYNMTIAFKQYLIQMNWLNANNGLCANYYL